MNNRPWRPLRHFALVLLALTAVVSPDLLGQGRRARASVMIDGHEAVEGEVLVRYRNAAAAFERARAEDEVEADEVEPVGSRGTRRMRARRLGTREMMARLRANPDVEFVEPNYIIRIAATPNDPSFGNLWGLFNFGQNYFGAGIAGADIDATLAWDISTGTRANVVGVVDTGIDYNHPDLAANIWSAPSAFSVTVGGMVINCAAGTHGFNAINNTCNPMDDHNHGTHVAGTIGAVGNNGVGVTGVNWTASMMGLKFLGANGSGSTDDAIKAIEFAVQAKMLFGSAANVRILSNSWGGGGFSQSLLDEINRANTSDMLFVAAAGNNGLNADMFPMYPAAYSAPNIISVAATDNRDQRASFSNYGAMSVHLGAPGVAVQSTVRNNGYDTFNGTSMATPHVSGAAALMLAACPMSTAALKTAILGTVDLIPAMAGITTTGGRLNANALVRSCTPPSLTVNGSSGPITVSGNSTITVVVANGPGTISDWVTLVPEGSAANHWSGTYLFMSGTTMRPATGISNATLMFTAPPAGGTFEFRLLLNSTYTRLATSSVVTVTAVNPMPAITALSTTSVSAGSPGLTLTVTGSGFIAGSQVRVNGADRTTTYVSPTVVTAAVPASDLTTAGTRAITVVNPAPGGGTSSAATLNVTAVPTLTVNGSSGPITVSGNSMITVVVADGAGMIGDWATLVPAGSAANHWSGTYLFMSGTTMRPATGISNASLTFVAPPQGGTFEFRLLLNSTYTRLATSAVVTVTAVNPTPAISALSTTSVSAGSPGLTLTVTGTGFIAGSQVRVNGADRTTTYVSPTAVTAVVPASDLTTVGMRAITVVNPAPGGGASSAATLNVTAVPTLTVNGSSGPITVNGNSTITVVVANGPGNISDWVTLVPEGSAANHWSGTYLFMSGTTTRPPTGIANASLMFAAPPEGGTFEFRLLLNSTYTRLATSPVVTVMPVNPMPAISALSTTSVSVGSPGLTLTVTGTGFIAGSQVRVNGTDRTTTYVSPTVVTAAVPASDLATAGTRAITVVNPAPGGGASSAATLNVTAVPTLTVNGSSGPITVNGGSTITVVVANGPGTISDWVTMVPAGSAADYWSGTYLFMSGTTMRPATGISNASLTFVAPRQGGTFEFRLLLNSTYTRLATSAVVTATAMPALTTVVHATGFSAPVAIVQDPTNAAVQFVVEQGGRIRVVQNGAVLPTDFLNLTSAISTGGERGLLGLALAPDYAVSGRFFVNFTSASDGGTVVARFRRSANPLVANAGSRFDLRWSGGATTIPQPFANHNGGHLAFGPDGFLYIGLGDGGSGGDPFNLAQNPAELLGKMLRIDVSVADAHPTGYQIPASNPFVSSSLPGVRPEIWSMGWRNPWRYSFDDVSRGGTGALIVGDVGQASFEEIDYEPANRGGRNYGWDAREGAHVYDPATTPAYLPLTDPIFEFDRSAGQSITGGFVYRGAALGAPYQGRYFVADFSSGRVWSLALTIHSITGEATASGLINHTTELGPSALGNVSSFGVDSNGELFILSYYSGTVLRVVPAP